MSSDKQCCVPGCVNCRALHSILHTFPNPMKDPERFEAWTRAIGGHHFSGLSNEFIYNNRRICRNHFEEKFYCRNNRLSNIAVPTVNLLDITTATHSSSTPGRAPLTSIENIQGVTSTSIGITSTISSFPSGRLASGSIQNVHNLLSTSMGVRKMNVKLEAEKSLIKKVVSIRSRLSKYKSKVKKQAASIKAAKNLISHPKLLYALEHLPKSGKILTMLQLRESKKEKKGRRFTEEEKLVALSLLKQSPKGYRLLRNMLVLPASQTLTKLVARANLLPGVNNNIFLQLKEQAEKMKPCDKICILLFDEMALKAGLTYNERNDTIIGFVNNGEEVVQEFADHAQVFMIRGLFKNYKQPVGFTFSASATKGPELAKQIKIFVREITKAGFTVVATVCDQGSGNRSAIKSLIEESRATWLRRGEEPKTGIILIDDTEIVPLYDPPHLIKCVRNNLILKDLTYTQNNETKTAKWSHIEQLYNEDPAYQGIKLIPKLTEKHVKPAKICKMKVKYATQIFSQTVGVNMGFLADKGVIEKECKETADILLFFDNLFDSVNGSFKKNRFAKPALGPVTPNSIHHKIWRDAKILLKSMKFITRGKTENVPTLNNWVWTLNGIEILINILQKKYNLTSVWVRHLNQDPLENFFGSIRSHGCRNTNPTPERFQSAFTSLIINNLSSVHAPGKNCEDDFATSLHTLVINEDCKVKSLDETDVDLAMYNLINLTPVNEKFSNPRIKAGLEYCSGYFAKKAQTKIFKNCEICKNDFFNNIELEYIKYREYQKKRWLCSPTNALTTCVSEMQDIAHAILSQKIPTKYTKNIIKTIILMFMEFNNLNCDLHKNQLIEFLINLVARFFIYNFCKNINKILCGARNVYSNTDILEIKAKKYCDKCLKKKQ